VTAAASVTSWKTGIRNVTLAIVTPLLEKNVLKTLPLDLPVIFSMSRVIVLAFACAMLRQIWRAGIAGWPEASLSIAIVLALPMLGALDKVKPAEALELAKVLLSRFGAGDVRRMATLYDPGVEPSKYDDHRSDSPGHS
jgi:hypothetical protein